MQCEAQSLGFITDCPHFCLRFNSSLFPHLLQTLKEQVKGYKQRAMAAEHAVGQKNTQLNVMENALVSLKQQLAVSVKDVPMPSSQPI